MDPRGNFRNVNNMNMNYQMNNQISQRIRPKLQQPRPQPQQYQQRQSQHQQRHPSYAQQYTQQYQKQQPPPYTQQYIQHSQQRYQKQQPPPYAQQYMQTPNQQGAFCDINSQRPQFQAPPQNTFQRQQMNQNTYNDPMRNEVYNTVMRQKKEQQRDIDRQVEIELERREKIEKENFMKSLNRNQAQTQTREKHKTRHKKQDSPTLSRYKIELEDFVNEGNDPYEILELPEEFTFDDVKKKYRQLALKNHPDKGGSKALFDIITKAFLYIKTEFEKQTMVKNSLELKQDYRLEQERMPKMRNSELQVDVNGRGFNQKKFNKIFDDYKLDDENNEGYGSWMTDRSDIREDIDIEDTFKGKFTKESFNNVFDRQEVDTRHTQLMKIEEPEPMSISNKLNFTEIGGNRPDTFTRTTNINSTNGLNYFDYKTAHTQSKLVDEKHVKTRKNYKSLDAFQQDRANQNFQMTEEDYQYEKKKKLRELKREKERRYRSTKNDNMASRHFQKVHTLMLGHAPVEEDY
jgi:curved DNA-binding protein CbpA